MKSDLCRLVKALSIKKLLSVVKFRPGKNSNWEKISQFEFFPGLNLTTENNYFTPQSGSDHFCSCSSNSKNEDLKEKKSRIFPVCVCGWNKEFLSFRSNSVEETPITRN